MPIHVPVSRSRAIRVRSLWTTVIVTSVPLGAIDSADAGVLVKYPFDDNADGSNGFAASILDTSVLSNSAVSAGPGLGQYSVGTDSWSGSTQVLKTGPGFTLDDADAADAVANDWYFDITLSAISTMDIRSVEADWSRGGTSGVRGWFVRSSLDGYASDLYSNQTPDSTSTGFQHAAFDLTGFTGLSGTVTFRFYIHTVSAGRFMDFQNIQFNSNAMTVVPGVAGATMIPAAMFGLRRGRRRD